jgi:copper chaperone CopZ
MKKIFIVFVALFFVITHQSFASCNKVVVDVNGLVCDFCARAIEKVFSKRDEVASVQVDLDNARVEIIMRDSKTIEDTVLTNLITDSGYNVTGISRDCKK